MIEEKRVAKHSKQPTKGPKHSAGTTRRTKNIVEKEQNIEKPKKNQTKVEVKQEDKKEGKKIKKNTKRNITRNIKKDI